jgi:D-alanyl-lipoteichoic acid acyltransferase DltB (MBOAT superfamily)
MFFVPKYIIILATLISLDYFLALLIEKEEGKRRKIYLIISVMANIGVLFFFKYFNFFNQNVALLADFLHFNYSPKLLTILLPVGLSFHVFQSLAYVIEVYKKRYKPEKNYISYALYVLFFPQLVAGPIERPGHLLPQLSRINSFDYLLFRRGCERILIGFFKKLVIADQLSRIITTFFGTQLQPDSATLVLVMVMFTYQLYCDFSGYSDIAVGSAMILGFTLTENFNRPFSSTSISEFWRRWHISLSSWLKDYLYYPIVFGFGGKVSRFKLYMATIITFTLIGLWHGASWTYMVFGCMHGVYLVLGTMTEKIRGQIASISKIQAFPKVHAFFQTIIVFLLVTISLIFFRFDTLDQSIWIIKHLVSYPNISIFLTLTRSLEGMIIPVVIFIVFMELLQWFQEKKGTLYIFDAMPKVARVSCYYAIFFTLIMFGYFDGQSFIYFNF